MTLVASIAKAHAEGRLEERVAHFSKLRLLIVDELGYLPLEPDAARLFFQLVSRRYERGAMLITSNRSVGEWGAVFGDPVVAAAIHDRLLHHSHVNTIRGDSCRRGARNRRNRMTGWASSWCRRRASFGCRLIWLDGQGLNHAITAGELLGYALSDRASAPRRGVDMDAIEADRTRGFTIATGGETAIREALREAQDRRLAASRKAHASKVFGRLCHWARQRANRTLPLACLSRDHILETMPVGGDREFLGLPIAERRVQSDTRGATAFRPLAHRLARIHPADMNDNTKRPRLRIRIVFGDAEMIGPGKAELLERIDRCGSIAAAGREMGMSYKRAWELVGTLNAMFRDPLVESTRGGQGGGGAVLTQAGREVVELYRAFERESAEAGAGRLADLRRRLKDIPEGR